MSRRRWTTVVLGAGLLLPAVLPLFLDFGLFPPRLQPAAAVLDGHDTGFDVLRTVQMARCLRSGQYSARWSPDLAWGYGVPLFQFYAPGPYYLSAAATLVGVSPSLAVKLVHLVAFSLSGLFAYLLGRDLGGRRAGLLFAALYTYAPYHLADVYVRSSLGESLAFAWPPLVLWGAHRVADSRRTSPQLWAMAGLCCLVLTHNVAALILYPVLALYVLALAWRPAAAGTRGRLLTLLLAPIGFTAYFWLPALGELTFLPGEFTSHQFHFGRHFVAPVRLFDPPWMVSPPDPAAAGGFAPQIGWALIAAWGIALTLRGSVDRRWWLLSVALAPLAVFGMLRASAPLWAALPPLQLVQLPWRFLLVVALVVPLAATLVGAAGGPRRWVAPVLIAAAVAAGLPQCRAQTLPLRDLVPLWNDRMAGTPPVGPARVPALSAGLDRETFLALPHPLSTTSLQMEYLPGTVRALPPQPAHEVFVASPECDLDQVRIGTDLHFFDVVCRSDGAVTANLFYFPGWTIEVDKKPVQPAIHARFGTMEIAVAAGAHRVKVAFEDTTLRRVAKLLSLLSLVGVAVGHHVTTGRWMA